MNEPDSFERLVAQRIAERGMTPTPALVIEETLSRARRTRQRPPWLATIKEPPMRISKHVVVGSPMARVAYLVILILAFTSIVAGGVAVGATLLAAPTAPDPYPAGPGTFEPGPVMAEGRLAPLAARLSDGRVLVVGGADAQERALATAELWDPGTGTFSPAGSLAGPEAARAVVLSDDRVLVIHADGPVSAELWDPRTGTFSPTGSLAELRSNFTATLLRDGRVLVAGGNPSTGSSPIVGVEVWVPGTGTFSPAGTLVHGRSDLTATLLSDGRVLIAGGSSAGDLSPYVPNAEIWDPETSTSSEAGSLIVPRNFHRAVALADGGALLIGGLLSPYQAAAAAERWDPDSETFVLAGTLLHSRQFGHTTTVLPDGRVLVVGGYASFGADPVAEAESWDPATATFIAAAPLLEARGDHAAALLHDGSVLVIGGIDPVNDSLEMKSNERWVPGPGA